MNKVLLTVAAVLFSVGVYAQDATLATPTPPIPPVTGIRVTHVLLSRVPEDNSFAVRLEFLSAENKVINVGVVPVKDDTETKEVDEFAAFAAGLHVAVAGEPVSEVDKLAFRALKMLEQRKLITELKK
jgi:hypothetical protein